MRSIHVGAVKRKRGGKGSDAPFSILECHSFGISSKAMMIGGGPHGKHFATISIHKLSNHSTPSSRSEAKHSNVERPPLSVSMKATSAMMMLSSRTMPQSVHTALPRAWSVSMFEPPQLVHVGIGARSNVHLCGDDITKLQGVRVGIA